MHEKMLNVRNKVLKIKKKKFKVVINVHKIKRRLWKN